MIVVADAEPSDEPLEMLGFGQHADHIAFLCSPAIFDVVAVDGAGNMPCFIDFFRAFVDRISYVEYNDVGFTQIGFEPRAIDQRLCCKQWTADETRSYQTDVCGDQTFHDAPPASCLVM